ncbi:hypothetical protein D3C81_2034170 [compost metagenome]
MSAALEVVGRPEPAPGGEPLDPDPGLAQQALGREQADRLGALHLQVEFHVVHQVLAHFRRVVDHRDAMLRQLLRRADA